MIYAIRKLNQYFKIKTQKSFELNDSIFDDEGVLRSNMNVCVRYLGQNVLYVCPEAQM